MLSNGLPDLIALAFESACDPERVQDLAVETGRYFAADAAAIMIWPRRSPEHLLAVPHGVSEQAVVEWVGAGIGPGTLRHHLENQAPLETFDGPSPAAPGSGWPDGAVLGTVINADDTNIFAMLLVRRAPGRFSRADHDSLRELTGYLRRSVDLNKRFIRVYAENRAARVLLDSAPRGILLLGQRGQATYLNEEARRICGAADGIQLENDELQFNDLAAAEAFKSFLAEARADAPDGGRPPTAGMTITRTSEAPPYQLIAYGLGSNSRQAALDEREGLAVAMLHDPSEAEVPDERLLKTYFGLTPAESQLTQSLCEGRSLPLAAEKNSISVNTARTHLRSVFQKVGVHSQAALVQRIIQSLHFANPMD